MEDEQIIELYFARSEAAIGETDRKYGRLCLEVANNILESRPDSEECVQDSYLGVWNAIPPTRPTSFRGFLLKIVRNTSLSRLRKNLAKKRTRDLEIPLGELTEILPDEKFRPDVSLSETAEIINGFLDGLDGASRAIFVRRYWFFDQISSIAKSLGFSESKVKTSLFRSREKLRKLLEEKGVRV